MTVTLGEIEIRYYDLKGLALFLADYFRDCEQVFLNIETRPFDYGIAYYIVVKGERRIVGKGFYDRILKISWNVCLDVEKGCNEIHNRTKRAVEELYKLLRDLGIKVYLKNV